MMKRVSIDVGGTFTDCVVLDEDGNLHEFKSSTTPSDPFIGFTRCLEKAAAFYGWALKEFMQNVELIIHGTTLATNTLITSSGANTGMITSKGFRDIVEIRRGLRPTGVSLYNVFVPPYLPLVPRRSRLGVPERVLYTGEIITQLDEEATREAAIRLREQGCESVAVCFLHSYANPSHEKKAAAICQEVFDQGYVSMSSEILPVWREFERFSTTIIDAYVGPVVADYLKDLESRLRESGFRGTFLMMLTNGLVSTVKECVDRAVYLLGSGPAAAPFGAKHLSVEQLSDDLISIDVGGTSFDVCVIRQSEVPTTIEGWVENHRVAIKMVDVHSIGAGGGSIAWIDPLGLLRVGPRSAGAEPGPACYGKGSLDPTVTDANLVLGYVPEDNFLGGEIELSPDLAREAVASVGTPLGIDVEEAALAIFRTTNSVMADQITEVCAKRGYDVRDFTLVVGGGAGPVHAAFLAELLGQSEVFIPSVAAAFSAFSMLTMDLGRDYARSYPARADIIDPDQVQGLFDEMESEASKAFERMGVSEGIVTMSRTAEMRYVGQFHEVDVALPSGQVNSRILKQAVESLHQQHEKLFAFSMPWMEAEFLTFRLKASAPQRDLQLKEIPAGGKDAGEAQYRHRTCLWNGQGQTTPIYDGQRLFAGNSFSGPAIIEDPFTTVLVPPGYTCLVDQFGNYVLRVIPS